MKNEIYIVMDNPKKVLVIGAGGFIGGFIVAESLRRGYETWAAVRSTTSRRFLTDERIRFIEFDYDDSSEISKQMSCMLACDERWDWIVYNLGATMVNNYGDFNRINFLYLRNVLEALKDADKVPDRFLFMSSLSALGPGDEENYTPYDETFVPSPNTRYGMSKIKAEMLLERTPWLNWIIFRPTGVYGPHEQDYLMMVKCIDKHWDFGVGFRKQLLTFIYVEDLACAIFDALAKAPVKSKYLISEGAAYTQSDFRRIVGDALGKKWVIPVRLPLWIVKMVSVVAEKYGIARLKPTTLNPDKYKIMKQRNWDVDITKARNDFGFNPQFPLPMGIRRTVEAYLKDKKENGKKKK